MDRTNRFYEPAELFLLRITLALLIADLALIILHTAGVDWIAYLNLSIFVMIFLSLGFLYRRSGRSTELASVTTTIGIFLLFTGSLSLFNYLLTPNPNPPIDHWLMQIDSIFGYSWPAVMSWASEHDLFNQAMRFSYVSTLPQITILIIALALTNRIRVLHSLIVSVATASLAAVLFWAVFPSIGPSAYFNLPADIVASVKPVVSTHYGAEIRSHLENGVSFLTPNEFRGMIAFPSIHIVLAGLATLHARCIRWLFLPYALVNLAVIPGVLVHGGHHLVDIPGGIALLVVALSCARMVLEPHRRQELSASTGTVGLSR